jgi:hypothetical protein
MCMKNYFLFILLFGTLAAQAQKSKLKRNPLEAKNYVEVGLNLTGAIQAFVHNQTDSIFADPYALSLKLVSHKFGIRFGAGYSYKTIKELTLVQASVNEIHRLDLRAGFDYQQPITERWRMYYGLDVLYGKSKQRLETSEGKSVTIRNRNENLIGGGPLFGLQFHLNKRISFQTEASLYVVKSVGRSIYTNSADPKFNADLPIDKFSLPLGVPRSISVIIRI